MFIFGFSLKDWTCDEDDGHCAHLQVSPPLAGCQQGPARKAKEHHRVIIRKTMLTES